MFIAIVMGINELIVTTDVICSAHGVRSIQPIGRDTSGTDIIIDVEYIKSLSTCENSNLVDAG
jgi:hypothetical protein